MYIVVEVIDTKNKESEESKWSKFNHYGLFNVTVSTMHTIKFFDKLEDAQEYAKYAKFGGDSNVVKKLDDCEDSYQQVAETIKYTITTTRTVVDIKNGDKICFVDDICSKYEEGV